MSIDEQVKELRIEAKRLKGGQENRLASMLREAADTIETLSDKLSAENMERSERYYNGGWILCEDRLPDNFEVVLAFTEENQMVTVARDGKYWVLYDQHIIKEEVIKWQPLLESYHES